MNANVLSIRDTDAVQVLAHPIRIKVLEALREPASAAGIARLIDLPRQKVNYHLKELARVGLVRHAGERRKGNFVEQLYQSVAKRLVISPALTWDADKLAAAVRDQVSLSHLAQLGERLQEDAAMLLDRAAYHGEQIPSTSVEAEIGFSNETDRNAFINEYLGALGPLLKKYGIPGGEKFKVTVAVYPDNNDDNQEA